MQTIELDFKEKLEEKRIYTEKILARYRMPETGAGRKLAEAMNYSLESPGKRLRPIFLMEAYSFMGGSRMEAVEPFMAAIEMIHSYSLVHDDLPAMDNDEYRRGRKTTHIVYGEDMAILAGDGLLNYAFETAMKAFSCKEVPVSNLVRALQVLIEKPSVSGMIGGQAVDVASCGKNLSEEELLLMYQQKTGALLSCALMTGAALSGASEEELSCFGEIGEKTGLAFQIRDDILDVESTTEELGKPILSDEKNHKTTFVTLKGAEEAQRQADCYSEEAIMLLERLGQQEHTKDSGFLKQLVQTLAYRRK